jgi:signal peptidase I
MSEHEHHSPAQGEIPHETRSIATEGALDRRFGKQRKQAKLSVVAEMLRTVLFVFILASLLRFFIVQPYIVEGSSMVPRFTNNDYLVVDKISYRFGEPQRGDIIVFRYPAQPAINYVKRIIALPGERIKIERNQVTIYNKENPEGFVLNEKLYLADNVQTVITGSSAGRELMVPEGQYYVMGDNRPASSDSREWGNLERKNIIGRVFLQAFPIEHFSVIEHARY